MRARLLTAAAVLAAPAAEPKPAAGKAQIAFEVRAVEVQDGYLTRAGVKTDEPLSDRQFRGLLESLQCDPTASVLLCPKVTEEEGYTSRGQE